MENGTKYEIINKETQEVYPVTQVTIGNEVVSVNFEHGEVVFSNIGKVGDLQNDTYAIREVGTHSHPDGTGKVNDLGVPTE